MTAHARDLLAAAIVVAAGAGQLVAQGGTGTPAPLFDRPAMAFPADPATAAFAPFGAPVPTVAAGIADLDFDGNRESWYLGAVAPGRTEVAVMIGRVSQLGRFAPYPTPSRAASAGSWIDGATLRRANDADVVLLLDPAVAMPIALAYQWPLMNADKRVGGQWLAAPAPWFGIPTGAYEIETADVARRGHDDIAVLSTVATGGPTPGTIVTKLELTQGGHATARTATAVLPVPCTGLRLLDADGDGDADAAVHAPGFGILLLADDGGATLAVRSYLPLAAGPVRDLTAGDVDGDGRDDLALVFDPGVAVLFGAAFTGPGGQPPAVLWNPPGVGALRTARVVDAMGTPDPDLVVLPADGRSFAVHRYVAAAGGFLPAELQTPGSTAGFYTGGGALGSAVAAGDVDGDGDDDLLWQTPDATRWITLRAPAADLAPAALTVDHLGAIPNTGYLEERITVHLPPGWPLLGQPDLEVGVYLDDPTGVPVLWHSERFPVAAGARSVTFSLAIDPDPAQLPLFFLFGQKTLPNGGTPMLTACAETTVTIHGTIGPAVSGGGAQRFASRLLHTNGDGQGQGAATGVKWRMVATPPLPQTDDELMPWN